LFEGLIEDLEEWKRTDAEFVNGCWNDNWMAYPSGCQFFRNANRMGVSSCSHFFASEPDRKEGMEANLIFSLLKLRA